LIASLYYAGQVNEYSPSGTLVQTLATANGPTGSAFDGSGNLYITEFSGNDILKLNATTGAVSVFSSDSILGDGTKFNSPESIAFGPGYTRMYVSDANRFGTGGGIHVIDTATGKGVGFYSLPSSSGSAGPSESDWLALNSSASLFMTNEKPSQGIMQINQATGDIVQPSFVANLPNVGYAMSFDLNGDLWLSDTSSILEYDSSGSLLRRITNPNFSVIFSAVFNPPYKTVYAGDLNTGTIFAYDLNGSPLGSFNTGSGVAGLSVAGTILPGTGSGFGPISRTFGIPFAGLVTTLQPISALQSIGQDVATITWGDGSVTSGVLSAATGGVTGINVFNITTHTYWSPGVIPMSITLRDSVSGVSETFHGSAIVKSRFVGLGDSYAAGEGAGWPPPQPFPNTPGCDWQLYQDSSGLLYNGSTDHTNGAVPDYTRPITCSDAGAPQPLVGNRCHRAITAYSHVVERLLAIQGMSLDFVACSGAIVQDMFGNANVVHNDQLHTVCGQNCEPCSLGASSDQCNGEPPQLTALGRDVSLITLTIGGNNLDFAGVVKSCVSANITSSNDFPCFLRDNPGLQALGYDTSPGPHDGVFNGSPSVGLLNAAGMSPENVAKLTDRAATQDNNLHDAFVLLYKELKALAPGARILLVGYPAWFGSTGTSPCAYFTPLEQSWADQRITLVDEIIQDATFESGVAQYVDEYHAFLTDASGGDHSQCAGDPFFRVDPNTDAVGPCTGRWINDVGQGIDILAVTAGSPEAFHPNPCGNAVEGSLAASDYSGGPRPLVDSFSINSGSSHMTSLFVPSGPGISRANFGVAWITGNQSLTLSLTDPQGVAYSPVQQGPVYTTWDVPNPLPGTWHVTVANVTSGDMGAAQGTVSFSTSSLPLLPPAGQVSVQSRQSVTSNTGQIYCQIGLAAAVAKSRSDEITAFKWRDNSGDLQGYVLGPTHTSVSLGPCGPFTSQFLLETDGNGSARFEVWSLTCDNSSCTVKLQS
jgi:hypothetical protein